MTRSTGKKSVTQFGFDVLGGRIVQPWTARPPIVQPLARNLSNVPQGNRMTSVIGLFLGRSWKWIAGLLAAVGVFFAGYTMNNRKEDRRDLKAAQEIKRNEKSARDASDDDLIDRLSR